VRNSLPPSERLEACAPPARATGLAALVLAGGASTRMQRNKPLLQLGGSTLLARAVGTFLGAGVRDVVVVVGHGAEVLRPRALELGARCAVNPAWERGMYSSLVTGLGALGPKTRACFVLPVDVPAVRSRTVLALARALRRTGASVIYPEFGGERGHPPLLSARLFPELLAGNGQGGLCAILARHEADAVAVPVLDEGVTLDLDTPADLAAACATFADRSIPTDAECGALLARLGAGAEVERHGRRVADLASWLALALCRRGFGLDVRLVHVAGRLHDLAKGSPDHARAGAARLSRLGFPQVARVVGDHTDLPPESRLRLCESSLVYLADKLVRGDRLVPLRERFQSSLTRCTTPAARAALERRRRDAEAVAGLLTVALGEDWPARLSTDLAGEGGSDAGA
jgi:CTP:molybdopterin cytidylyltransferase MocA